MAKKSKHAELDRLMAQELGLTLSDRTLPLKKVQVMTTDVHGFYFAFWEHEQCCYDTALLWWESLGCRIKPQRFLMTPLVKQRVETRRYQRWYYRQGNTLHRVQVSKATELFDRFWFQIRMDNHTYTHVIVEVDAMFLRKKPLKHLREPKQPWSDHIDSSTHVKHRKRA
jgi:hypothetical protein